MSRATPCALLLTPEERERVLWASPHLTLMPAPRPVAALLRPPRNEREAFVELDSQAPGRTAS